ncbi:hypothetical protein K9B35_04575 [Sphingomonas sp. R647]|uniref:hypothetical protein n=1 Tax=Sphingomonas sp. R647 TaxID=2875233 RepID=UPI001CD72DA3|nr:hypothetical protein [Sphingomonas sp. R647]MCA1197231.1 hypothetical protein [Sphingomonas sp. R647]
MAAYLKAESAGMKTVYRLEIDLERNPERVALTQALTLNPTKPQMGLSGRYGLFGSDEWWAGIADGKMPLQRHSGIISRAYRSGQDSSGPNNTIDLLSDDGPVHAVGIYLNDPKDVALFLPGHVATITYALDELKPQAAINGGSPYSKVALEMAVSLQPAAG